MNMAKDKNMDRSNSFYPEDDAQNHHSDNSEERFVEIRVKGHLDSKWSQWLEGLEVKLLENGEMILFGPIVDQASLMGVLNKLGRLNLTLLSLNEVQNKKTHKEKIGRNLPSEGPGEILWKIKK
jgi:hypothetical protein